MTKTILAVALVAMSAGGVAAASRITAFSIGEARRHIEKDGSVGAEVARLAGITRLIGMVYDAETGDPILIGVKESAAALDLDSLVVAMRAVLVLKQWPLVSIDPSPNSAVTGELAVRLEGGIEDSIFGRDFLSADVRLKRLGLGLDHASGIESYFAQREKLLMRGAARAEGSSRFWFYAVDPGLEEQNGVFLIRKLELGVRAQTVGWAANTNQIDDVAADAFAKQLGAGFAGLAREYPELARLKSLYQMVAVARGLEMTPKSAYAWWLTGYRLRTAPTPREFSVIRREEQIGTPAGQRMFEVSGGIQFRALTVRLMDGDATALKEAVLLSRPVRDRLSWEVPVDASLLGTGLGASAGGASSAESGIEGEGSTLAWKWSVSAGTRATVGGIKADVQISSDDFQMTGKTPKAGTTK